MTPSPRVTAVISSALLIQQKTGRMSIPLPPAKRYLARRVIVDGQVKGLSLVELDGDRIVVTPFAGETHSTVLVDGTLIVDSQTGRVYME